MKCDRSAEAIPQGGGAALPNEASLGRDRDGVFVHGHQHANEDVHLRRRQCLLEPHGLPTGKQKT